MHDFVQYGSLNAADAVFTVGGDLVENGDITVAGTINVAGSVQHQNGTLKLGGGTLNIGGTYDMRVPELDEEGKVVSYANSNGVLVMEKPADYMKVGGDFYIFSVYTSAYNKFSAGTLELGGDFEQGGSGSCFNATKDHRILFTGTKTQVVTLANSGDSGFGTLAATDNANADVVIEKGRILSVENGAKLRSFGQYGSLDLNGNSLQVTENLIQSGNINANGGKLSVGGDYGHKGGWLDLNGARIEIDGSYILASPEYSDGELVGYKSTEAYIIMNDETDYMLVTSSAPEHWSLEVILSRAAAAAASMQEWDIRSSSQARERRRFTLKMQEAAASAPLPPTNMQTPMFISQRAECVR